MRAVVLLVALSACGRSGFDVVPPIETPSHVPETVGLDGAGHVVLGSVEIDTGALTIDGAPPIHGQFVTVPQLGAGPELAMLQADHITIADGATVHVIGPRGLLIVGRTIELSGILDVSANGTTSGPGSAMTRARAGEHPQGDVCDSGGGGGGHATIGGRGGDAMSCQAGGDGGPISGDEALTILTGGGSGGNGVSGACGSPAGGGGGGAIQLTGDERVVVHTSGQILGGGGGGSGGPECGDGDAGAAGGGGAGGAIFIEAPHITIDGLLLAHGGGGGAGGNGLKQNGPIGAGGPGANGTTRTPAAGGIPPAPNGGLGGAGGTDALPGDGGSATHNAGGGGGAAGRIVIRGDEIDGGGLVSPAQR